MKAKDEILPGVLFLLGILSICVGALLLDGTRKLLGIWLERESYLKTEFEIVSGVSGARSRVHGRIALTRDEITVNGMQFSELTQTHDGIIHTLQDSGQIAGRRLQVWYNAANRSFLFGDLRVLPASSALPDTRSVVLHGLAVFAFFGAAVALIWPLSLGRKRQNPDNRQIRRGRTRTT